VEADVLSTGKVSELRLALIDSRALVRDAVAFLLQSWAHVRKPIGTMVVLPFQDVSAFQAWNRDPANPAQDIGVVALNIGASSLADDRNLRDIGALQGLLASLPLVLMADCLEPKLAIDWLRKGIKGYIPATSSPPVAIEALQLVWAGGTFIPPDLLQHVSDESLSTVPGVDGVNIKTVPTSSLTAREHSVIGLLRQGNPNKIIAAELGISESTVKVYVRQIMRKLGAINRTHACYLLQNRAAAPGTEPDSRIEAAPPTHEGVEAHPPVHILGQAGSYHR
jgi:DNA-binding NarL/FixJ family response regulator